MDLSLDTAPVFSTISEARDNPFCSNLDLTAVISSSTIKDMSILPIVALFAL